MQQAERGRIRRHISLMILACLQIASMDIAISQERPKTNILFIFDSSGSMKKKTPDGLSRILVAKGAMGDALSVIDQSVRLGLMAFGHRQAKNCQDIEVVKEIGAVEAEPLAD